MRRFTRLLAVGWNSERLGGGYGRAGAMPTAAGADPLTSTVNTWGTTWYASEGCCGCA